jgi:hypothetical protein
MAFTVHSERLSDIHWHMPRSRRQREDAILLRQATDINKTRLFENVDGQLAFDIGNYGGSRRALLGWERWA